MSDSPTTEATVLANLVKWSEDCPDWQRDALRRLCAAPDLDDTDATQLLAICRGDAPGRPLDPSHVRAVAAGSPVVTLRHVRDVRHVNALAEGEKLTFTKSGLTVVYGDNGSGKSGYARILKQMCRARLGSRSEAILPNIYDPSPGTPTATIDFSVNNQNASSTWTSGSPADPVLSAVSVFDSRTASVHVDAVNDVAYTPFPLRILGQLAKTCQDLRSKLEEEIKSVEAQTPQALRQPPCRPDSEVGKLLALARLGKCTPAQVQELARLDTAESDRLTRLDGDLASDPVKAGRQLSAQRERLQSAAARIASLAEAVSREKTEALRAAADAYAVAREAAAAASSALFEDEPLPHIGSDAWRSLWEAARKYSEEEAYPGSPFPVALSHGVCVLCQQEIGVEAGSRLNRFEQFIKDDSQRRQTDAKDAYEQCVGAISKARLSTPERLEAIRFVSDELGDEKLAAAFRRSIVINSWRMRQVIRDDGRGDSGYLAVEPSPVADTTARLADLSDRMALMTAEADSAERRRMTAERDALADRKWLATVEADVLAEIERAKKIAALKSAMQDTVTTKITLKSTEIAESLVTNALRAQFAREIGRVGVAALAIELKREKSLYGVPRFKVSLTRKPAAGVGAVLSEGEYRCVALAAFLAELATSDSRSAIVFDDPVSSLDHMHRASVAKRLAEEAVHRQTIVFTHDIAFLFMLDEACGEIDPKPVMTVKSISRGLDNTGFCSAEPPLRAKPLALVIEGMQHRLDNERIKHDRGHQAEWETTVRSLQEQLRTSWERAVEDAVGPVLRRLSNKVSTDGLVKLTSITVKDCEDVRDAFGRCSALLHSEARGLNTPLPTPDRVQAEITALKTWVESMATKQKAIRPV
ncbi:AAA family ATPase [Bradyrhizobium ottawaense]|uniref:AAA family ATPase n=1 Tax=Bradyrhizobium ottawaense TaxID=931866 RepID=UPI003519541F